MMFTAEQLRATYLKTIDRIGEDIIVRRYTGTGTNRPKIDVPCRARVTGYAPRELVGTVQQGDRFVLVLAADVTKPTTDSPPQAITLPLTPADKVVIRGKEMQILSADDSTRRVGGDLVAIEIQARG